MLHEAEDDARGAQESDDWHQELCVSAVRDPAAQRDDHRQPEYDRTGRPRKSPVPEQPAEPTRQAD